MSRKNMEQKTDFITPDDQRRIVLSGFELLKRTKNYKQVTIVRKLKNLDFKISKPSFSNILNGRRAGSDALWIASNGIRELVAQELNYCWDGEDFVEDKTRTRKLLIVPDRPEKEPGHEHPAGFLFHESGRLSIAEKVNFFSSAQVELVEFGITLNTFSSYFFSRSEEEFKVHIETLLDKGINIKCYLLDPASNEALLYFNDRSRAIEEEKNTPEKIKEAIRRLEKVHREFAEKRYTGAFEVYAYKHIPSNYFLIVDGESLNGKMMASHYLYGERRANCPVIEFSKKDHRSLFRRYWNSYLALAKDAKRILG
jgi:hypothetical protein